MSDEPAPALEPSDEVVAPLVVPQKKKGTVVNPYVWGTGRRKRAVARVRIRPGAGEFLINKREVDTFFCTGPDRASVRRPLEVIDVAKSYDVFVNVHGGGTTGQAGAVMLGLARALVKSNPDNEPKLREYNLLSRDPRKVERKKYGRRGARRRFQFSKR
ncbi:MAG: 30S ribosomal protein S9 [Planctomycetes bacterium]|nr:30S ribosomal protein S9 [Planctomycetota bacterium]